MDTNQQDFSNENIYFHIFGSEQLPTIYYFTGYGMLLKNMLVHIKALESLGFKVFGFQYDRRIISDGNYRLLPEVIDSIRSIISENMMSHITAGIYGISLGSFVGFNIMERENINRAIFNTGGSSAVESIWNSPHLINEKKSFYKSRD